MNHKKIIISILLVLLLVKFFSRYKSWKISSSGDAIAFSHNSRMVAYATGKTIRRRIRNSYLTGSSTVEIREVNSGRIIHTFDFFDASSIAFSPDNSLIAIGGYGGEIKIWRIQDARLIHTFKKAEHYKDKTNKLLFTPDGQSLVSSTIPKPISQYSNSNISVWDLQRGVNINTVDQPFTCAA
ncbi:MAG: hypothetical protein AAF378_25535, partial [Cyanobacteria bacterium P01_A01_bin.84]